MPPMLLSPCGPVRPLWSLCCATCVHTPAPRPTGSYGATSSLPAAVCTGLCPAGYTCGPGSIDPTAVMCPPGQYSPAGSVLCTHCPGGTYGATPSLPSAACSGPCTAAGGAWCPLGLTVESGIQCVPGQYHDGVDPLQPCQACPLGRYGATASLATSDCSGPCLPAPGRQHCLVGAIDSRGALCPANTFSVDGVQDCTPCPRGSVSKAGSSACLQEKTFYLQDR